MDNKLDCTEGDTSIEHDSPKHRRRSIIREFCLTTSTHGLPGIARSNNAYNRLFWSISFIGFTLVMIYFVAVAIMAYFNYPTQIDIDYVNEWPQYFPAFSLCNVSPLRLDQFREPFLNYTKLLGIDDSNDSTTLTPLQASYVGDFIINTINGNRSLESFFFPLSSMLCSCTFNNVPCSTIDFIPFISSTHGLCYTFNAKLKSSNDDSNLRYGNEYGGDGVLSLGLYVHSHQYVPYVGEGIGIVSLVHDNNQLPLIETAGIELGPGRKHKLGYKKKTTYFAPPPYTQCTQKTSVLMQKMFDNYNGANYGYSQVVCYQICRQVYVYEQCGCVNPSLWNTRSVMLPGTQNIVMAPLCNQSNICYRDAINDILVSASLSDKYCSECTTECLISDFIIQTSSMNTPAAWQYDEIKACVENFSIPLPENWAAMWREHIRTNYLAVNVVRETTIVENNTQSSILSLTDVLSNIGGQSGLWIGVSFLSLMEVVEMLYRLIRYQWFKVCRVMRARKQIMAE